MSEKEIKYSELKSRKELYQEKYVRVVKKIIANDNIKDLKELKNAGIDLTTIIGSDKYTWNYAAEKGAVNCLEFLLENFHNLKILKDDKERVFYTILSSTRDTNKMIKMLSFYGKYFKFSNETNNPSQTPVLTELLKNELTEVAIYLFENGCNLLYVENEKIIFIKNYGRNKKGIAKNIKTIIKKPERAFLLLKFKFSNRNIIFFFLIKINRK